MITKTEDLFQDLSITKLDRALYAGILHFAKCHGMTVQDLLRRILGIGADVTELHAQIMSTPAATTGPVMVRLNITDVPRGTVKRIDQLCGGKGLKRQIALRGIMALFAEDPDGFLRLEQK